MMLNFLKVIEGCLVCSDVTAKLGKVEQAYQHYCHDKLLLQLPDYEKLISPDCVGFPLHPQLVPLKQLPKRGFAHKAGRAALLHSIAHIEFNAINLALDAAYRFREMPVAYYLDWLRIAHDEVRHFKLLEKRLAGYGVTYGELPAHRGLWDMAEKTAHSLIDRMALIPRYLEARGLDVTPAMIQKFESIGDLESVDVLNIILKEEVSHVEAGTRWFSYLCEKEGTASDERYLKLVRDYMPGKRTGPLNIALREQAGFSQYELEQLK